jgi:hypothetical protein
MHCILFVFCPVVLLARFEYFITTLPAKHVFIKLYMSLVGVGDGDRGVGGGRETGRGRKTYISSGPGG